MGNKESTLPGLTRSSKTHSIDSLLQQTGKHHLAQIILSGNIIMCWGMLLREAWRDYDVGRPMWPLMLAILRSNGHQKERSKLKQ